MFNAIYSGSFDPVTNGHLDIIKRASKMVDTLTVAILENPYKKFLFSVEERKEHLRMVTKDIPNVKVDSFQGLLVDYAKQQGINVIIRGLRNVNDFSTEFVMAITNRNLSGEVETLFLATDPKYLVLSSSAVKQVAMFNGNIDGMVPDEIKEYIIEKYKK